MGVRRATRGQHVWRWRQRGQLHDAQRGVEVIANRPPDLPASAARRRCGTSLCVRRAHSRAIGEPADRPENAPIIWVERRGADRRLAAAADAHVRAVRHENACGGGEKAHRVDLFVRGDRRRRRRRRRSRRRVRRRLRLRRGACSKGPSPFGQLDDVAHGRRSRRGRGCRDCGPCCRLHRGARLGGRAARVCPRRRAQVPSQRRRGYRTLIFKYVKYAQNPF